jgi:hypothetical protein
LIRRGLAIGAGAVGCGPGTRAIKPALVNLRMITSKL